MSKKKKKRKKEKKISHKIKLRVAEKMDFLELDKYDGNKKIWKSKIGIPYWMYNSKGKIENKNYILNEHTNLDDFSDYLVREQILILTSKFN